jgi:hypothetical protein
MSNKENLYKQCRLERATDTGTIVDVSWIPSHLAKVGKKLSIQKDGVWVDGWVVAMAGSTLRTYDEMNSQRSAHKRWEDVLDRGRGTHAAADI